ncbi:hypothetical protein LR48_Vigan03g052900 [Vigna angularis]|uniref:Myosin motor domain-containing protein n=1 Tax=Phaseolus angularis TaxID=3914 RepID=A0A0L9U2T8_PHAAN|nr:hypothetical protein LR48_Vigan03g052900 [Vigna angularis]
MILCFQLQAGRASSLSSALLHPPSWGGGRVPAKGTPTLNSLYQKLQLWLQLPNGDWELVKIITTSGAESLISLPDGKVLKVKEDNLVPANPNILNGVDDLMELSYLNVPADLFILQYRYNQDMIYTKAGPVLVAVNPFNGEGRLGKTGTAKIAMQYLAALGGGSRIENEILKTNPILEGFEASVMASTTKWDWELVKIITTSGPESVISLPDGNVLKVKEDKLVTANAEILNGVDDLMELSYLNVPADLFNLQYSGEGGVGKTETAKIAMQYLVVLGGGSGIENKIVKTNPILEAFGNGKALRNDNLSRFVLKVKEDNLVPAIPDILNGVDDLMELSYLNVPADLFILQYRYNQDMIYVLKVKEDNLVPAIPDILNGVDDLMHLSYLNEPAVLFNLQYRQPRYDLCSPDILNGVDDLMQPSYLNEAAVLFNLQYRHNQDMIYTKAGPVLVALNPFQFKDGPAYKAHMWGIS